MTVPPAGIGFCRACSAACGTPPTAAKHLPTDPHRRLRPAYGSSARRASLDGRLADSASAGAPATLAAMLHRSRETYPSRLATWSPHRVLTLNVDPRGLTQRAVA